MSKFLHAYDNCNLGSINIAVFYEAETGMDWQGFSEAIYTAVRMLDNTIDLFNHNVEAINEMAKGNRRIGLGIMGFADLMFKSKTEYGSERCINFIREIGNFSFC